MTQNEDVKAICCRPEAAGDVVSGRNVKTIVGYGYVVVTFEVASSNSFWDITNHFVTAMADIDDSIHVSLNDTQ